MSEMTDASSAGPSAWERDLYAHLSSHVEREAGLLQAYTAAAEASPSKALRYLANLLIDDETRHHRPVGRVERNGCSNTGRRAKR